MGPSSAIHQGDGILGQQARTAAFRAAHQDLRHLRPPIRLAPAVGQVLGAGSSLLDALPAAEVAVTVLPSGALAGPRRHVYPSKEALDAAIASGSTEGMPAQLEQLDELVVTLAANAARS